MSPCQHQVSTEPTMTPKQGQSLGLSAGSVPGGVEEGNSHTTHAGARSCFDGVGQWMLLWGQVPGFEVLQEWLRWGECGSLGSALRA